MTHTIQPPPHDERHFPPLPPMSAPLWAGVIGAPMAWGVQLQIGYALVPWVCEHGHHYLLHLTTIVFALTSIVCGFVCYRYRNPPGHVGSESPRSPSHTGSEQEDVPGRTYFLAILGALSSGLFALVIIAQGIASFFIDPCIK
jgi:hypothetical protein